MPRDAEPTRRRILSVALAQFRERGFAATTMRKIAEEAGLSLGAAYHHFASKQAIVAAYYQQQHEAHAQIARQALAQTRGLRERIAIVLHTGLDVRGMDRKLLRELAPLVVGPDDTLSAFSRETGALRQRSIQLYEEAIDDPAGPAVPRELRDVLALALWGLQMGVLLYFAHDESPRQQRTRALVDGAVDLTVAAVQALSFPPMAPFRDRLAALLSQAGLLETK